MRKILAVPTIFLVTIGFSSVASALPFLPEANGGDGLFIKFNNKEQISPSNAIVDPDEGAEGNWGIFDVTTIQLGDFTQNPQDFDPVSGNIWDDGDGDEFTGMFGGITVLQPGETGYEAGVLNATGGWLDLYYDPTDNANLAGALPSERTGVYGFEDFTDGTFLARSDFLLGAIGDDVSITGGQVPTEGGTFAGIALSFGGVADINSDGVIDALDGAWASALDSNYFNTDLGPNTADIRFRNIYSGELEPWSGDEGSDIIGANSTDPAKAYVVPEPATMSLFGIGLLGLAGISRRRKNS